MDIVDILRDPDLLAHKQVVVPGALLAAADEIERLRGILRRAYDCLPDMPAVCCQTVQLAVESAWRSCVYCGSDLVDDPRVAHPYCSGCGAS